ncbi:MAG: hypothetical protein AB2A00_37920 [Myxococcota bacterium]
MIPLYLVVAAHLFGGMRTPTSLIQGASLVVIGKVQAVKPRAGTVQRVEVNVVSAPCVEGKGPRSITVHELGDHSADYVVGETVIFPLIPASQSPHRDPEVPPDAWSVEQASSEVVRLAPDEVKAAEAVVKTLCRARDPDARASALVEVMAGPVPRLAGGAARDLMVLQKLPPLTEPSRRALLGLLADATRPASLRVVAAQLAGRSGDDVLQQATAERIAVTEEPEVVASAIRALSSRPELVEPRIVRALEGRAGAGRLAAARFAGTRGMTSVVPQLVTLAKGPEPDAAAVACQALVRMASRESVTARARLITELQPPAREACAVAR